MFRFQNHARLQIQQVADAELDNSQLNLQAEWQAFETIQYLGCVHAQWAGTNTCMRIARKRLRICSDEANSIVENSAMR